jgi:PKD repeat protein
VKFKNQDPPFLLTDHTYTNSFGYYSFLLELPFEKGTVHVSTVDCTNEMITNTLEFSPSQMNLTSHFSICHQQQSSLCRSDFVWLRDIEQPNKVTFRQTSFGDIDEWFWDFGDGNSSQEPDPVHYYENDSPYNVCLTVFGNDGTCVDVGCYGIEMHDDTLCQARFTYYSVPGERATVQFYDLSLGNITSWFWDFGDGRALTGQNPRYTYASPGIYNVCLAVGASGNQSDTLCIEMEVIIKGDCQSSFIYTADPLDPMTLHFIDLSEGEPDSWLWDFGDGNTAIEQHPVHTYIDEGVYNVMLTVSDQVSGCQDKHSTLINLQSQITLKACYLVFALNDDNSTFRFTNLSFGQADKWYWDFGDGTHSTQESPAHVFDQAGTYQVCLTISDQDETVSDTFCKTIYSGMAPGCAAQFVYDRNISDPMICHFSNVSSGEIINLHWNFGDGHTSNEENPTHIYSKAGFYVVCLTVETVDGCTDVYCDRLPVNTDLPFQSNFDSHIFPSHTNTVQFANQSTGDHDIEIWNFGDGETSFCNDPQHAFESPGSYDVCLHILNIDSGLTSQNWKTIDINPDPFCKAGFVGIQSVINPKAVKFVDLSKGEIAIWSWDFGDGNSSTLKNPLHLYLDGGTYTVCLEVTDISGTCTDQYCVELIIDFEMLCQADFDYIPAQDQSLKVGFIDRSEGIMNEWLWDFGDGNISTEPNPEHAYADSGVYVVSFSISNSDSLLWCNAAITKEIFVFSPAPDCHANFIAHPDSGVNKPNFFHFHDISAGQPNEWLWDFGDGNTSTEQHPRHQYAESGAYEVSLTIAHNNPYGDDCSDVRVISIESPDYFHIGGFIYAGLFPINNPVHTGDTTEILLYRYKSNKFIPIDTSMFTEYGYYYSLFLLQDHYMIKSRLTDGSVNAANYFPTYFGDQLMWQNAQMCYVADSNHYNLNIHLIALPEMETGIGDISGSVFYNFSIKSLLLPALNTQVLLYDHALNPIKYVFSENNGKFDFSDLPLGTYFLVAESAGMICEKIEVTLTSENPSAKDVLLELYDPNATSINNHPVTNLHLRVFPNPVTETLFIDIPTIKSGRVECFVFDISGRLLLQKNHELSAGNNQQISINTMAFQRGIYFLRVREKTTGLHQTVKFVK